MTRQEQAFLKINKLQQEIVNLHAIRDRAYDEQVSLGDYYMDNTFADSRAIGREQQRLDNLRYKCGRKIEKLEREIYKIRQRYCI